MHRIPISIITMDYTSEDISVKGWFETRTGLKSAVITTAKGSYTFV